MTTYILTDYDEHGVERMYGTNNIAELIEIVDCWWYPGEWNRKIKAGISRLLSGSGSGNCIPGWDGTKLYTLRPMEEIDYYDAKALDPETRANLFK